MITLEEVAKQNITFVGMGSLPEFNITSRTDKGSYDKIWISDSIQELLNNSIEISNYSAKAIKHLTFVYIVMQDSSKGVNWKERMYYDKEEKEFNIEIKFPNYEKFITATKQEALHIMAVETLRGAKKFLPNINDFKFEQFYTDLERLFKENKLI